MIKGPDATAGSILILWKNIGIKVPTKLEITIAAINENPTQPEITNAWTTGLPFSSQIYSPIKINAMIPRNNPLKNPTFISLNTSPTFSPAVRFSSINTRMVTASDCVPTFPAISRINDWKHMTMGSTATTVSNTPTTVDTASPRNSRITSHGSLFFILSVVVSSRSSSAVKPANFA